MLSRKDHTEKGIPLPESWCKNLEETLKEVYEDKKQNSKKTFCVQGFTYPNEVLAAVSFFDSENDNMIPVTVILSADLSESEGSESLLKSIIDSFGVLFDEVFSQEDWNDYYADWRELKAKKKTLFYQITRENLKLTQIADELLKEDS